MSNNDIRSARFDKVVTCYGNDEADTNLIDLLADAQHWCDHTGNNFHWALAQACRHYVHELNDQQQDERRMIP